MTKAVDLFAAFASDEKAEVDGVYTTLDGCGDTEFLIAAWGNKQFNRVFSELHKKNKKTLDRKDEVADAKAEEIFIAAMAKTLLVGWKGTVAFKGSNLEYTEENARKLLALKHFRVLVEQVSRDDAQYKAIKDEEEVGN